MKKSKIIMGMVLAIVCFAASAIPASAAFRDVPREFWAYNEIQFLTDKNVIQGFSNGTFKPTGPITRKDAAIMLVRAMKMDIPTEPSIIPSDMKETSTGYNEVIAVVNAGMFTLEDGKFNPTKPLLRKEMAKALATGYQYEGQGNSSFTDIHKDDPYYTYIDAIAENKVTSGYMDGTFKPSMIVNRAQFSTFMARIYGRPLEYSVKLNGETLETFRNSESAIAFAVKNPGATVHPVSNSLITYNEETGKMDSTGIKNGVIIYNGSENAKGFTPDFFDSYLTRNDGVQPNDLFDTFIFQANRYKIGEGDNMQSGDFSETAKNTANYDVWQWYLDRILGSEGSLANLDKAAAKAGKHPNVYIGIPYPKKTGDIIDLDGNSLTNTTEAREDLVNWFINQVENTFYERNYSNINLKGYYWTNETVISQQDEIIVASAAKVLHAQNRKFIYSPHALSTNFNRWQSYGFDGAFRQPNAFRFTGEDAEAKLHRAFLEAQIFGCGINFEIEPNSSAQLAEKGLDSIKRYAEFSKRYGLPGRSMIVYQDLEMIHRMATNPDPMYQQAYQAFMSIIQ
ncbi:DUF4855 domain-containing protein [Bacillus sp. 1P06AnD]|uniref:DUF4855 domain-containing protein n=1 Tax=Bacillus sp. 1P06AnD TaxID=3132208 RepID=UPI0039A3D343